jgi:hypothetical protein
MLLLGSIVEDFGSAVKGGMAAILGNLNLQVLTDTLNPTL